MVLDYEVFVLSHRIDPVIQESQTVLFRLMTISEHFLRNTY